jgi:ABC-type bacteriocin/lantibiotic exporter with double-glycine peptidase domain
MLKFKKNELVSLVSKSLTPTEKFRYLLYVGRQFFLGLIDLIALALISLTSVLVLQGKISLPDSLNDFGLENIFVVQNAFFISSMCALMLVIKTIFSLLQARSILIFAEGIQNRLVNKILDYSNNSSFSKEQNLLQKDLPIALNEGISALCLGVIGYSLLAFSEGILLIGIGVTLIFVAPILTSVSILIFGIAFLVIHKLTSGWAIISGKNKVQNFQDSKKTISDLSLTLKSVKVSSQYRSFNSRILKASRASTRSNVDIHLVQQVPKYIFELTIVTLGIVLGLYFALSNNVSKSIGILVLFLGGLFRLLPSLLRLQGAILIIQSSIGESSRLVSILNGLLLNEGELHLPVKINPDKSLVPQIKLSNLSFSYPNSTEFIFRNFSCEFPSGQITSIKGPSGVGKTTLADLALGLLIPTSGHREIFPKSAFRFSTSYMPQEISLVDGTFAENIALGVELDSIDLTKIEILCEKVGLRNWVSNHAEGLMVQLDRTAVQLSGGQKQRLGLARALYFDPVLLVVDEPTSALDDKSEDEIFQVLSDYRGLITIIIIAHTEKTNKFAQNFIYLK